jgi:N-acetylmuramoyl-L-alanine amidase
MVRIVLDPGHGQNYNKGAVAPYYEGNQMFKLAYYLKPELERYGIAVKVTRSKVTDDPALSTRGKMAKGYNLFLSLHSNAPPADAKDYSKIKGTSIYDSVTRPNKALADALGQAIAKTMGHNFRGTNYRRGNNGNDYYSVLRNAIAVGVPSAILIEHGFHTNPDDCRWLLDDNNLKKLAKAEAEVIVAHYKIIVKEDPNLRYGQTLKRGAKGDRVKRLQEDLIKLGYKKYLDPYGADGSFGGATEKAVRAFQADHKLAVDGSVGPATQAKIEALLKAPATDYKKMYEDEKKKRESAERKLAEIKKIIG